MVAYGNSLLAVAAAKYTGSMMTSNYSADGIANCAISQFVPQFPTNQTGLVVPSTPPKFLGLAFGVQNYTCTNQNNYTSVGAVGEVIDVSCHVSDPGFDTIQTDLYNIWSTIVPHPILAIIDLLHSVNPPEILAQHYFVPNPSTGQGLSPKWDFTSSGKFDGNPNAYMVGVGQGSIPAPDDPSKNVAWLNVGHLQGDIANQVFRFDTVGGQPPSSCTFGQSPNISVKYTSKYIYYGGSIN